MRTNRPARGWLAWGVPVVLIAAGTLIVIAAPPEATLGDAIRYVYVHVSLTWAGMLAFAAAGLLGLGVAATGRRAAAAWMRRLGLAAVGLYAASVAVSALAAQASWGGVFWQEPRMRAALQALALAAIVLIVDRLIDRPRLTAGLQIALALAVIVYVPAQAAILHPGDAAQTTPSLAIRLTFLSLLAVELLLAAWALWRWRPAPVTNS